MLNEVVVAKREMVIAEKSVISRKGRRVRRTEHKVACTVNFLAFALGVVAPQNEHKGAVVRH